MPECAKEATGEEDISEDDVAEGDIPEDEFFDDTFAEMFLPLCNSPRAGQCAYEGSEKYPDQFIPDPEQIPTGGNKSL